MIVLRTRANLLEPFIGIHGGAGIFASRVCEREQPRKRTCDAVCVHYKQYPGVESIVDTPPLPQTNQLTEEH